MYRKPHRPSPKDVIVRIHSASGEFYGTGCLTFRSLIVTCAHVVRDALKLEQVTGAEPTGRLRIDFPFLPEQPSFDAEVAPGGWGWIYKVEPRDDVALLRLLGASPIDDVPCFSPERLPANSQVVLTHGFTKTDYRDGGPVEGKLGSDGRTPAGTYTFDTQKSSYIASPGFSGAPVFWRRCLPKLAYLWG